jgi:hypothetical protein
MIKKRVVDMITSKTIHLSKHNHKFFFLKIFKESVRKQYTTATKNDIWKIGLLEKTKVHT